MSQKSPAFSFYVRDWLCSLTVQRMTGQEVKAYMYLICSAWLEHPRATLPDDDTELALMARVSDLEWKIMKPRVMRAFILRDGRWISERLENVSKRQDQNRLNGLEPKNKRNGKRNGSHFISELVSKRPSQSASAP